MKPLRYYWCVKVPELSKEGEIYLHADIVEILDGNLLFKRNDGLIIFSIAKGNWTCFFAASLIDGRAVHVEHWIDPIYIKRDKK